MSSRRRASLTQMAQVQPGRLYARRQVTGRGRDPPEPPVPERPLLPPAKTTNKAGPSSAYAQLGPSCSLPRPTAGPPPARGAAKTDSRALPAGLPVASCLSLGKVYATAVHKGRSTWPSGAALVGLQFGGGPARLMTKAKICFDPRRGPTPEDRNQCGGQRVMISDPMPSQAVSGMGRLTCRWQ
jgi:hypothetical protein